MSEEQISDRRSGEFLGRSDSKTKKKRSPGSFTGSANLAIGAARLFAKSLPTCNNARVHNHPSSASTSTKTSPVTSEQNPAIGDKDGIKKGFVQLFGESKTIVNTRDTLKTTDVRNLNGKRDSVANDIYKDNNKRSEKMDSTQKCFCCEDLSVRKECYNKSFRYKNVHEEKYKVKKNSVKENQDPSEQSNSKYPKEKYSNQCVVLNQVTSIRNADDACNFSSPKVKKCNAMTVSPQCKDRLLSSTSTKLSNSKDRNNNDSNKCMQKKKCGTETKSLAGKKEVKHLKYDTVNRKNLPERGYNYGKTHCHVNSSNSKDPDLALYPDHGSDTLHTRSTELSSVPCSQNVGPDFVAEQKLGVNDDWNIDHYDLNSVVKLQAQRVDTLGNGNPPGMNNSGTSVQLDSETPAIFVRDDQPLCCNEFLKQSVDLVKAEIAEVKLGFNCDTDSVCSSGSGRGRGRGRGHRVKPQWQQDSPNPGYRSDDGVLFEFGMNSSLSQEDMPRARFCNESGFAESVADDMCSHFSSGNQFTVPLPPPPIYQLPSARPRHVITPPPNRLRGFNVPVRYDEQRVYSFAQWNRSPPNPQGIMPQLPNNDVLFSRPVLHQNNSSRVRNGFPEFCGGRNPRVAPPPGFEGSDTIPPHLYNSMNYRPPPPPGFSDTSTYFPGALCDGTFDPYDYQSTGPQNECDKQIGVQKVQGGTTFSVNQREGDETTGSVNSSGTEEVERTGRGLKRVRSPPRNGELQKKPEIGELKEGVQNSIEASSETTHLIPLPDGRDSEKETDKIHKEENNKSNMVSPKEESLYNYRASSISPGWLTPNAKDTSRQERSLPLEMTASRVLNLIETPEQQRTDYIDKDTGEYLQGSYNPTDWVTDGEYKDSSMTKAELDKWMRESKKLYAGSKDCGQKKGSFETGKSNHLEQTDKGQNSEQNARPCSSLAVACRGVERSLEKEEMCPEPKDDEGSLTQINMDKEIQVDHNSNILCSMTERETVDHREGNSQCFSRDETIVFSGSPAYAWPVTSTNKVENSRQVSDQQKRITPFSSRSFSCKKRSQSDSALFSYTPDRDGLGLTLKDQMFKIGKDVLPECFGDASNNVEMGGLCKRDTEVFLGASGYVTSAAQAQSGSGMVNENIKKESLEFAEQTGAVSYDRGPSEGRAGVSGIQRLMAEAREKKQQLLQLNMIKSKSSSTITPEPRLKSEQYPSTACSIERDYTVKYVAPHRRTSLSLEIGGTGAKPPEASTTANVKDIGQSMSATGHNTTDRDQKVLESTPQGPPSGYEASESDKASESDNEDLNTRPCRATKEVVKFKVKKQRPSMVPTSLNLLLKKKEEEESSSGTSGGDVDWFEMKLLKDRKIKSDSKLKTKRRTDDTGKDAAVPFWSTERTAALFGRGPSDGLREKTGYGGNYEESTPSIKSRAMIPAMGSRRCKSVSSDVYSFSRLSTGERKHRPGINLYSGKGKSNAPMMVRSPIGVGTQGVYLGAAQMGNKLDVVQWKSWKNKFQETYKHVQTSFVDTHCHIDFLFERSGFKGTYSAYREKNKDTFLPIYEGCIAIFCNPRTFSPENALWKSLTEERGVHTAVGCHPKSATDFSPRSELGMRKMLDNPNVVALGEIGLDYSGTFQQHAEVQKHVLIKQCNIAIEKSLPLVIHSRDSEQDITEVLGKNIPRNYKIHRHCFTGSWTEAEEWLKKFPNSYIGLTPLITWYNAARAQGPREVARKIPLNKLLLETDAPYFVPKRIPREEVEHSHPGYAVTVAYEVAKIKGVPLESVLQACRTNTYDMYGV